MNDGCPSDASLELFRKRGASSEWAAHVAGCAHCEARLTELEQDRQEFRQYVYPATIDHIIGSHERQSQPWFRRAWPWLIAVPAVAALLLVVRPHPVSDGPETAIKGDFLSVYVGGQRGGELVPEGGSVPANGVLRFEVHLPKRCWVSIVSVDSTGTVSQFFPVEGNGAEIPARTETLPGGALLDGVQGPERVFGLCSPQPLSFDVVKKAVLTSVASGEAAVRTTKQLEGLPEGVLQSTVLLEKKP